MKIAAELAATKQSERDLQYQVQKLIEELNKKEA